MGQRTKVLFLILLLLGIIVLLSVRTSGQSIPLPGQVIPIPAIPATWTLLEKIDESEEDIQNIRLTIGKKKYSYKEERIYYGRDGRIASVAILKLSDPEREIALKLLNIHTGSTEIITVKKRGSQLITPAGYELMIVKRRNGIQWNGRNTHFRVVRPTSSIVLKIAWPDEATRTISRVVTDKKGKKRTINQTVKYIKNIVYTPYSADDPSTPEIESGIHTSEIYAEGSADLKAIIESARLRLREKDVRSKAFPQYIVGDMPFISPEVYERLLMIEQMDESEFNLDPINTAEKSLVILRANRGRAFATCNSSKPWKACGPWQFTDRWVRKNPGTYSAVVRAFPRAQLIKNFPTGAMDHINAGMASILLHDLNLVSLSHKYGQELINDPVLLEEVLAGCYNGSPKWTHMALNSYFSKRLNDWSDSKDLRKETLGYLHKLRYLIRNELP